MRDVTVELGVAPLLKRFNEIGGVLDYVFLSCKTGTASAQLHREAALRGMESIDARLAEWARSRATPELSIEKFFRVRWDESKLSGNPVSLDTFWGTDVVGYTFLEDEARSIPPVDGYKSAFFLPPYNLRGSSEENATLFSEINRFALGGEPQRAEIFAWSTDWSNYFDPGHEWWGAFYWTIRPAATSHLVVIGASSTD